MTDNNITSLLRETAASMSMSHPNKKREFSAPLACAITEAELSAKYRDKPLPQLSKELRAILGVGIPEISE